jgi:hypothetical protein
LVCNNESPSNLLCAQNCLRSTYKFKIYKSVHYRTIQINHVPVATIFQNVQLNSGPGIVDGIAIGYGLDGPGIKFRWGRDFPQLSTPDLGPTQPTVQWLPGLSRG